MSQQDDDDGGVIILSVAVPAELVLPLENLANGENNYGDTKEQVAAHYLCRAFSLEPPRGRRQTEQAAVAPADEGGDPE